MTTETLSSYLPRSNVLMLVFGAVITGLITMGVTYMDRTVSEVSRTARSLAVLQSDTTAKVEALRETLHALNARLERGYTSTTATADFALRDERIRQLNERTHALEQRLIHVERLLITGLRKQALEEDEANDSLK